MERLEGVGVDPVVPLLRLRLELDRAVRSRAFVARALVGDLRPAEYADLLGQLGALIDGLTGGHARGLSALAELDGQRVDGDTPGAPRPPCPTVALVRGTRAPFELPGDDLHDIVVSVIATPWVLDAAEALAAAFPGATALVEALAGESRASLSRLEERLLAGKVHAQRAYAVAEMSRGALLGALTYLDSTWPAPIVRVGPRWPSREASPRGRP